ncbi:glycosyltransferase family 2 protein [Prauserella muralis]|uniref:N-acetylglucosaminyl-diphospho-decaprenol L-rhamnosyltransferase n=1 Tax=Prauserella muralis TaxID=588067 RepID=A0A2V4BB75_9PSEU|nr:N-acetylglucosaminyl-diphospho-decaprenol L-rhamnosyltransferase [Prauserella muralis]TWE23916.1 N-acetylglucosaminyl-diphospho-decaprenol L-rhamnosyltransferase [Prauserella muralis]
MHNDRVTQPKTYGDGVAVVTVTYSPGETLERFLDTLDKATDRDVRVVLADNGSVDGAPEKAAERANVRLVRTGENLGYGAGANRGVAELDESIGWIVVANPDLEWDPGSLDTLLEATERWPRGGAFGPLIREPDGSVYPSARLLPSLGRGVGHALFGKVWPGNPWTRAYRQEKGEPVERTAGWLSGSCQLLRREAFDSVEGFDPRYFMYFEDVDLGDRLGRAGWLNVYVPSAGVMHIGGQATSKVSARMLAAHHDSAYRYLADRHRGLLWKPLLAAIRAGLAVRLRLETRRG